MWKALPVLWAAISVARAEVFPIRAFGVADGLAEDRINSIVEDARGFVWFAGTGGISRFDGYRFVTWGAWPGTLYRGANAFIADPKGNYWVAMHDGVRRFRGEGGPLKSDLFAVSTPGEPVNGLVRNSSGRLIAWNSRGGFEIAEDRGVAFTRFAEHKGPFLIDEVMEDRSGRIWVVVGGSAIGIYDLARSRSTPIQTIPWPPNLRSVDAMLEAPEGYMWLGTDVGLLRYERHSGQPAWKAMGVFGVKNGLGGREVKALLRRSNGEIWVGDSEGISRFRERDADHPRFSNLGAAQGLTGGRITALTEDRAGNVWAGTESSGVMLIKTGEFTTYQENDGIKGTLLQVLEDRRTGTLMIVGEAPGNSNRVLTFFDRKGFHWEPATSLWPIAQWIWQRLLIQSRTGNWWAATRRGLCRFPAVDGTVLPRTKPEACYTGEAIFHIFEDSRGNVWASAQGDRLLRWDSRRDQIAYLSRDGAESAEPRNFGQLVSAMAEDRDGNIWMGKFAGGLMRYAHGHFTHFGPAEGAPPGVVNALYPDSHGRLWIGTTGGGLTSVVNAGAAKPHFKTYHASQGIGSDIVRCIVEDRFGKIWAGTTQGAVRLEPISGAIERFANTGKFKSAVRDRDGTLWFATSRGLARIVPRADRRGEPRDVVFTSISIAGKRYPLAPLGASRVAEVTLDPDQNHVEIEFAAPGGDSGGAVHYRVRLEGADSGWSAPQTENHVDYHQLMAGSYRFFAKSLDSDETEGASFAEFDFRILPPVWRRWWFELPVALLVLGFAYWLHTRRVERLVAIERVRSGIASDLHDDIGASLARISILSEVARVQLRTDTGLAHAQLVHIGSAASEMLESMNDIVWSLRSSGARVESLIERMRDFATDVLGPAGIKFTLACDDTLQENKLSGDARRQLLLIFKECMHNICKHAACREVRVELVAAGGRMIMTVSDDGRGPQWASASRGNGVPSMTRRARSLGGEIEIGERSGGGYRVTLQIPIRAD